MQCFSECTYIYLSLSEKEKKEKEGGRRRRRRRKKKKKALGTLKGHLEVKGLGNRDVKRQSHQIHKEGSPAIVTRLEVGPNTTSPK